MQKWDNFGSLAKFLGWLQPSLTPQAAPTRIADIKLQSLCHAGSPSHPISLKTLTNVIFNTTTDIGNLNSGSKGSINDAEYTCPTCRRTLSNNVASYVLKPCGHVLCVWNLYHMLLRPLNQFTKAYYSYLLQNVCVDTLVKSTSPQQCAFCDTQLLPDKKKPIIAIKREGTGFAAGGIAEAKRFGLSFQA